MIKFLLFIFIFQLIKGKKWIGKEIKLYEKIDSKKSLKCKQCQHKCVIDNDHRGICGIIHNYNGKLYNIVNTRPCSVALDPIEKKPLYHFYPGTKIYSIGTVGCNMRCSFCQNWQISQNSKGKKISNLDDLRSHLYYKGTLSKEAVVREVKKIPNCNSIAYTYNEPTVWLDYVYDIAKYANKHGIKNVLVSNGFQSLEAINEVLPYIDGINVDLKSWSNKFYSKLTGVRIHAIKRNIEIWLKTGVHIEVTTLIIPDENDSEEELRNIAQFLYDLSPEIVWHLSAYYDAYRMKDSGKGRTPISSLIKAYHIGKKIGLKFIYLGNVQSEKHSTTFCPKCGSDLIKRGHWGRGGEFVNLNKNGFCKKCGYKLNGYWSNSGKNTIYPKVDKIPTNIIKKYNKTQLKYNQTYDGVTILFASQTGVSEQIAVDLFNKGKSIFNNNIQIFDLENYNEKNIEHEKYVIFITSTMFYGRVPRNGEDFYKYFTDNNLDFNNLNYQIIGIGSTGRNTPEHLKNYQIIAREIDERFQELGGKRINKIYEFNKKENFKKNVKHFISNYWDVFVKFKNQNNNSNNNMEEEDL